MESIKISSVKRTSGTISNFIADFSNGPIESGTYSLVSGVFTNSFYNVNNYNNKIYFKENSTELVAILTNGFYNSTNIIANIKDALENASLLNGSSLTYTVTINSITNKMSITVTTGNNVQILINNKQNTSKYLIGFLQDSISSNSVTGDSPINLTVSNSFNIRIDGHGVKNSLRDNSNNFYSFSVPIMADSLQMFFYESNFPPKITFENRINQIRVSIFDEENNPVELQNEYYFILNKFC